MDSITAIEKPQNFGETRNIPVTANAKELDSKIKAPIMALILQIDQGTRLRALDSGERDFFKKPFDILEVSQKIQDDISKMEKLEKQLKEFSINI